MTDLDRYGPWALIAGASEGLGAAFADESASRGCNVVLIARRRELMEDTAAGIRDRHGVETRTLVADLARADIGELVAPVTDDIDVGFFVYNAAFAPQGLFVNVPMRKSPPRRRAENMLHALYVRLRLTRSSSMSRDVKPPPRIVLPTDARR